MSLNPIGYVVQLPIPDGVTLYLARFTRGGVELTADLDRAMLFDTEGRAKDARRISPFTRASSSPSTGAPSRWKSASSK